MMFEKSNRAQIKKFLKEKPRIQQWKVAAELGIHEASLSRLFRYEISPDKAGEIISAIKKLKKDVISGDLK